MIPEPANVETKTATYNCRRCGSDVENPELSGTLCSKCFIEEPDKI